MHHWENINISFMFIVEKGQECNGEESNAFRTETTTDIANTHGQHRQYAYFKCECMLMPAQQPDPVFNMSSHTDASISTCSCF